MNLKFFYFLIALIFFASTGVIDNKAKPINDTKISGLLNKDKFKVLLVVKIFNELPKFDHININGAVPSNVIKKYSLKLILIKIGIIFCSGEEFQSS